MTVQAIVCAKDEGPRIASVLSVLVPIIPTLVVDDGSTDDTANIARQYGAEVLSLKPNRGKGRAMLEGFRHSKADVIFFCDADLKNLMPYHVIDCIVPVMSQEFDMVVGLRDWSYWNDIQPALPLISGERAVRRSFLESMPEPYWSGYGVEVAMNDHIARREGRIGTVLFDGVTIHHKWEKDGAALGAARMVDMAAEVYRACETVVGYAEGGLAQAGCQVSEAPKPATLAAKNASTEEVMNALSTSMVEAAAPKMLPPIWAIACCICGVIAGPVGLVGSAVVGGLHINSQSRRAPRPYMPR